jgi:hypothetical protein
MTTFAVLTPFTASRAVELGNRTWVKKVLPVGDVAYQGRMLHFTRDYLGKIVRSFQDRAYDQVPFQLADSRNTHTNDPERTRGEITGMELRDDGLYVTAQLTPEGEQVLTANPRLGVSARIVEGYDRSDGRFFPAAIQHVLGTLDPRIPGLGGWEAIEASNPVGAEQVFDLSSEVFVKPPKKHKKAGKAAKHTDLAGDGAGTDLEGTDGMPDLRNLNEAEQARLAALLALPDDTLEVLAAGGTVLTPDELDALTAPDSAGDGTEGGEGEMTDEELDALIAAADAADAAGLLGDYQAEGEPVAALSSEAQFAIDLAVARQEETARELAVVTARLREEDYQAEKRHLADMGVPPYITELARPLLENAGRAIELANGKTVDAGGLVRRVLTEYASQVRLLDLGTELGSPHDEPDDAGAEQATESRNETVARFKNLTGLK